MNVVVLLSSAGLILAGAWFLARRRWWIGTEFLAASLVVGMFAGPTAKALFTWLALVGLAIGAVVLLRGLRERPKG